MNSNGARPISMHLAGRRLTRRHALGGGTAALAAGLLCRPSAVRAVQDGATPVPIDPSDPADGIIALARQIMEAESLRAVILRVTMDGEELVTAAMGACSLGALGGGCSCCKVLP